MKRALTLAAALALIAAPAAPAMTRPHANHQAERYQHKRCSSFWWGCQDPDKKHASCGILNEWAKLGHAQWECDGKIEQFLRPAPVWFRDCQLDFHLDPVGKVTWSHLGCRHHFFKIVFARDLEAAP